MGGNLQQLSNTRQLLWTGSESKRDPSADHLYNREQKLDALLPSASAAELAARPYTKAAVASMAAVSYKFGGPFVAKY